MSEQILAFSGHRDGYTDQWFLEWLYERFGTPPAWTWRHGGAEGFDTQVDGFARFLSIRREILVPDYDLYAPKIAPLKRDELLIDGDGKDFPLPASFLVVCWDGRKSGGTFYTKNYAEFKHVPVILAPYHRLYAPSRFATRGGDEP